MEWVRSAPALVVAHTQMKRRDAGTEKKKEVAGWSTNRLEELANRQALKDTHEMVQWRSISQEGINDLWEQHCAAHVRRGPGEV